jgi:hypothetical protein
MEAKCSSETFVRTNLATGLDTQNTATQFLMRVTVLALIEVAIFLEELYIF